MSDQDPSEDWERARRMAVAVLRSSDSADDVAQDTWIAAQATSPTGPRANWIAGIARRVALSRYRAGQRRLYRETRATEGGPPCNSQGEPAHDAAARGEVIGIVREELDRLDPPLRRVITARMMEDLTVDQVAAREGTTSTTIQSRQRRALALLRDRLGRRLGAAPILLATLGIGTRLTSESKAASAHGPRLSKTAVPARGALVAGAVLFAVAAATFFMGQFTGQGDNTAVDRTDDLAQVSNESPSPPPLEPVAAAVARPKTRVATRTPLLVRVVDSSWQPVRGASIRFGGGEQGAAGQEITTTDADGYGTVPASALDRVDDHMTSRGTPRGLYATLPGRVQSPVAILTREQRKSTGVIDLPLEGHATSIRGQVLDSRGRPVSGAIVADSSVKRRGTGAEGILFSRPSPAARSGLDGRFSLEGLRQGRHVLLISAPPGSACALAEKEVVTTAGVPSEIEVALLPECSLDIDVVDDQGRPALGAEIRVYPRPWSSLRGSAKPSTEGVPLIARTSGNGRAFLGGLPPRTCIVEVSSPSGGWRGEVDLSEEPHPSIRATLDASPPLRLEVVDESGAPLGDLQVAMTCPELWFGRVEDTAFDGRVEIPWAPLPCVVTVTALGCPIPLASLTIDEQSPGPTTVTCPDPGEMMALRGSVRVPPGFADRELKLRVRHTVHNRYRAGLVSAETAEVITPPIPHGTYELMVDIDASGTASLGTVTHGEPLTEPPAFAFEDPATVHVDFGDSGPPGAAYRLIHSYAPVGQPFTNRTIVRGEATGEADWILVPGHYAIFITSSPDTPPSKSVFRVFEGEELELETQAGSPTSCALRITAPKSSAPGAPGLAQLLHFEERSSSEGELSPTEAAAWATRSETIELQSHGPDLLGRVLLSDGQESGLITEDSDGRQFHWLTAPGEPRPAWVDIGRP